MELRETLEKFFDAVPQAARQASPFEAALEVWVRRHYAEDVSLEDAAAGMGMSPFYFSRQIKAATGRTFLEFITAYRMERAKQRLTSTELTVSEVGRAVGYPDPNYFTKVFKKYEGCTPSAYRGLQI